MPRHTASGLYWSSSLVKRPRLLRFVDLEPLLKQIRDIGATLVVANSLRTVVPRSRAESVAELSSGVIVGEYLFLDTYDAIRLLHQPEADPPSGPRLIAGGGIIDVADVLDIMAAGAEAVQLCTALDRRAVQTLFVLRAQLSELCKEAGSLQTYLSQLRSSDSAWQNGIRQALSIRATDHHEVRRRLDHETHELRHTTTALELECRAVAKGEVPGANVQIPEDLHFVSTCGTASSCLLAHLLADRHALTPVHFDEVSAFMKSLKNPHFRWDFAILSKSHLHYLNTQQKSAIAAGFPEVVEAIASAQWQLMGVREVGLDGIRTIYHFGGTGARAALTEVTKLCRATPEPITPQMLHPILRYWDKNAAIIAKPPLSQIYASFCPEDIQDEWMSLWSMSEPLYLVNNGERFDSDEGKAQAVAVANALHELREYILQDTERAARQLRATGFFQYVVRLLGFKALGVQS